MKSLFVVLSSLVMILTFGSMVMAQEKSASAPAAPSQEQKLEKFSGVVENVDEATKDVMVQFHKEKMTFSVGDHTKIMEGKKEVSLSDLKKGMWASVGYEKEGNKLVAESIHSSMPRAAMSKKEEKPSMKGNPSEKTPEKS